MENEKDGSLGKAALYCLIADLAFPVRLISGTRYGVCMNIIVSGCEPNTTGVL
jgi:hypothetical protein